MKIAICEDNPTDLLNVKYHLNQYSLENHVEFDIEDYSCSTDILNSDKNFDIAFLDIEIDEYNGIQIGKALQEVNPDTIIICITAYNHYLDEALDIGIMRFFDKPIDSLRFYNGLEKAINLVDKTEIPIFLKDNNQGEIAVKTKDIIYIEIQNRKTKVVTKTDEYISKDNIKVWKNRLNKSYFFSPHNSFIINMNYITYYNKITVTLDNKYNIPIAYSKRSEFKTKFMALKGE